MTEAYICDYIRTPIGRFGGALSKVRPDDLGAIVLKALEARNAYFNRPAVEDVVFRGAKHAGEDNRNIARVSVLLAGRRETETITSSSQLCRSGVEAVPI